MGVKNSKLVVRPGFDPSIREGNPDYGNRMQLYCRSGHHLAILPDGRVIGVDDDENKYALLEFSSVDVGEVKIKGIESNLYLAMNKKSQLYGEKRDTEEAIVFVESFVGQYNCYLSRKWAHMGWYIGLKKNGTAKPGKKTKWGQKSTQFLPRRISQKPPTTLRAYSTAV